jgi:hypothetical protein
MGRKSREHRERRAERAGRAHDLEQELKRLTDGDSVFWTANECPEEVRVSNLQDILAFESVGTGPSLFEGLQEHGLDLPPPEKLDERQSVERIRRILRALARLRIFLVGFEDLDPRQFYAKLWNETLWEGCYVEKRNPGAFTLIDVSHKMSRSDLLGIMEELQKPPSVH